MRFGAAFGVLLYFWCSLSEQQLTSPRESNDPACVLHNQAQGFSAWGRTVSMSRRQPDHCRRRRRLLAPARRPLTEISQLPARSNCAQNISPAAAIRLCWPNLRCKLICVTSAKSLILWLVSAPCLQNKTLIAGLMEGFFCVCAGSSQKLK